VVGIAGKANSVVTAGRAVVGCVVVVSAEAGSPPVGRALPQAARAASTAIASRNIGIRFMNIPLCFCNEKNTDQRIGLRQKYPSSGRGGSSQILLKHGTHIRFQTYASALRHGDRLLRETCTLGCGLEFARLFG